MTEQEWLALTHEQKVEAIIEAAGESPLHDGGYPSQWVIENGKVYWATVGYGGRPDLTVEYIR